MASNNFDWSATISCATEQKTFPDFTYTDNAYVSESGNETSCGLLKNYGRKRKKKPSIACYQCCREILFLFNRLFRDISRNEDLIAIFIPRYIINIYYQLITSYSLLWC